MWTRTIGYTAIIGALAITAFVVYRNSEKANETLVYAPPQIMRALWADYKAHFLEPESSRTLDPSRGNITTSEGQSYTMLRAVWMGDKETFDTELKWTRDNLGHMSDHLFSWLYGKRTDGTYGVIIDQKGATSASDADTDIALALVFAYARWQEKSYLTDARAIIGDIWKHEVVPAGGKQYLAANNTESVGNDEWILLNPSYFNPAAYRIFAQVDPAHPWQTLATNSYSVLEASMTSPLGGSSSADLPPDWVEINRKSGALRAPSSGDLSSLTTNFGFDALRVPWRIALAWQWFGDEEALATLQKMSRLKEEWASHQMIKATYSHEGIAINNEESPAMYGGIIGYFVTTDPELAKQIYEEKLVFLFSPGSNTWKERLPYYDDNLAWFGIGLYNNLLPNLATTLPAESYTQL
jgi:endoglucanase